MFVLFCSIVSSHASPITDADADLTLDFAWENDLTKAAFQGQTMFMFSGVEAPWIADASDVDHVAGAVCDRWAKKLCWQGDFETEDGGFGIYVMYGVQAGNKHEQHFFLQYDNTGAEYSGRTPRNNASSWSGTMSFPSLPDWSGVFTEAGAGSPGNSGHAKSQAPGQQ